MLSLLCMAVAVTPHMMDQLRTGEEAAKHSPQDTRGRVSALLQELDSRMDDEEANDLMLDQTLSMGKDRRRRVPAPKHALERSKAQLQNEFDRKLANDGSLAPQEQTKAITDTDEAGNQEVDEMAKGVQTITTPAVQELLEKVEGTFGNFQDQVNTIGEKSREGISQAFDKLHAGNGMLFNTATDIKDAIGTSKDFLDETEGDADEVMEEQTDNSLESVSDGVALNKEVLADLKDTASDDASDAKDEQKDIESNVRDEVADFKNDAASTISTDNEVISGASVLTNQVTSDRIANNKILANTVDQHKVVTHKVEQMLQRMIEGVSDADRKEQNKVLGTASKGIASLEKDASKTNKDVSKAADNAAKASGKGMNDVAADALTAVTEVSSQQNAIGRALDSDIKQMDNLGAAISDEATADKDRIKEEESEASSQIKGEYEDDANAVGKEEEKQERQRESTNRALAGQGANLNENLAKGGDKDLADLQEEGADVKVTNTQNENRNNKLLNDASKEANDFPSKDSVDLSALQKQEDARHAKFTDTVDSQVAESQHELAQASDRAKSGYAKVSSEISKISEKDKAFLADRQAQVEAQTDNSYQGNAATIAQYIEDLKKQEPDPDMMKKASDLDFEKADLAARLKDQLTAGADASVDDFEGIQTKLQRAAETDGPAIIDELPVYASAQLSKVTKDDKSAQQNITAFVDDHLDKQQERRDKDVAYFNSKANAVKSAAKTAAEAAGAQADEVAAEGEALNRATEGDVLKAEQAVGVLEREAEAIAKRVGVLNDRNRADIKAEEDKKVQQAMDKLSPLVEATKAAVEKIMKTADSERTAALLAGKATMEQNFADLQGKASTASDNAATDETLMEAAQTQFNNIEVKSRTAWAKQSATLGTTEKLLSTAAEGMTKKLQNMQGMLNDMLAAVETNVGGAEGEAASSIKATYDRVQSIITSIADNSNQETNARMASVSNTVAALIKRASKKAEEHQAEAEAQVEIIKKQMEDKKAMQARLSARLAEADNEVRTDDVVASEALRQAGTKENEANSDVVGTGIDLADLAGAGVQAANKATQGAAKAGEQAAMQAMQKVQVNKHGEQARGEEFGELTERNKHNANSALKQEDDAIDHSKIIEESTAKNAEERFAELAQHIDDEIGSQASTIKKLDQQTENGVKGQLKSMDQGINALMQASHDLELSQHGSEAKREKFDADLEKVQTFTSAHEEKDVQNIHTRSRELDYKREDVAHWMNHFINQDMKFKQAVDKAFQKEDIYMDKSVMGALNALNDERLQEQNQRSSVHRAFEDALAKHEAETEKEIAGIYAKRDELLAALEADSSLDAKRKAMLIAQIKATAENQARALRSGAGDMKTQVAEMKTTWEKFQRLTRQALSSTDQALAAHAALSVGDHLSALKKKVQDLVGGSKWFSMIQLHGKEFPFFTHLTDESIADLADRAEQMQLTSERARHRVEVQDPEYAKELVKLANKDSFLERQLA